MAYDLLDGVPLFGSRFPKTVLFSFAIVPVRSRQEQAELHGRHLPQPEPGEIIDAMKAF
jgi:hypothetical protein